VILDRLYGHVLLKSKTERRDQTMLEPLRMDIASPMDLAISRAYRFVEFSRFAPPEAFSGSMHDRKSRTRADFGRFSDHRVVS
jgi:hypothetical protein